MSTMNKEKLKGLQSFLKDDIWRVTEDEVSKSRGILYNAIKIATLSVREFTQGRILNKASALTLSLIHISEPTRQAEISYAVFCLKKKKTKQKTKKNKI